MRRNRRDVDLFAGVTDPVEMLRIMHTRRQHDPLVNLLPPPRTLEQIYTALTVDEARCVMQMAADRLSSSNIEEAEDIAKLLAVFTDYGLDPMLEAWVEQDHFWPEVIFRGAGAAIRDKILRRLTEGTARPDALGALAWIGDETVVEFFRHCVTSPPAWNREFCVGPVDHSRAAGWELAGIGRRDLFFRNCYAITPSSDAAIAVPSVRIAVETEQRCPWCQRSLVKLLEIDVSDRRFAFLEWPTTRLEVLTCDMCTCFGSASVFAELDGRGQGQWAPENKQPGFLPERGNWGHIPWAGVPLSIASRRPIHAADWCLPTTLSQIGGLPAWVQDAAYPRCCRCSQTMMFLAQIDNSQFPAHEGMYYAFVCRECRTTATTYQ